MGTQPSNLLNTSQLSSCKGEAQILVSGNSPHLSEPQFSHLYNELITPSSQDPTRKSNCARRVPAQGGACSGSSGSSKGEGDLHNPLLRSEPRVAP